MLPTVLDDEEHMVDWFEQKFYNWHKNELLNFTYPNNYQTTQI